jgi:hypothetical protein
MDWQRIAAITEDGQKYTEYISRMENSNDFKIMVNKKISHETSAESQLEKVNIYADCNLKRDN